MNESSRKTLVQKILAGSLIFYIFSGISSLLNYAFYPVVARFVDVTAYGEIQFLVSMFTQLSVGFVVLNILAIIISAELVGKDKQHTAIRNLNVAASIVIFLIVCIGSTILYINQNSLGFHDNTAIIALGVSLFVNVPFTIAIGKLQGNNMFVSSGVVS